MAGLDLTGVANAVGALFIVDDTQVTRAGGEPVLDEDTGELTTPEATVIYTGKGAVLPLRGDGEQTSPQVQRILETSGARWRYLIPLGSPDDIAIDDLVNVTAVNAPLSDAQLLEQTFRVVAAGEPSTFNVLRTYYLKAV